jgi:hypothetical protein
MYARSFTEGGVKGFKRFTYSVVETVEFFGSDAPSGFAIGEPNRRHPCIIVKQRVPHWLAAVVDE